LTVSSLIRFAVSFTFLRCFEEAFVDDASLSKFFGEIVDGAHVVLSQLLSLGQLLPFGDNLVSGLAALAVAMLLVALEVKQVNS